ncbi:branched-chain amino acid ABC transporter permease [Methylobacterium oryzihabitans]|uniref:Branched-chain amino acid ABC transporter permease n=1 Tax=Methylobacterium oryzihabitans TaxID=2499852 RepID=A0A3S2VSU9_9HYPH|nr:branched-chain amino acid ABC transporter permease [Methylobacterium oryzihabitans]RVU20147.1 branched-chain amino acid ABC transporter permease [Methylobacterium oryzihabitans]
MTSTTLAAVPAASPEAGFAARRRRKLLVAAVVFAAIAALPYGITDVYLQNVLILTLMYAALSQSWNILGGYCGQISLGHALYFGIGAYATSVLFVNYGIVAWGGMLVGGVLSALVALALGWPCFRLAGHYFSIATIVIAEIGLLLVHNWDFVGGAMGIQWPFNPDSWWTLQFARDKVPYVHFALGLFAVVWFVTYLIEDSRWGYWWRAVKDDAQAAESLGVEVFRSKMAAAAVSAFFTAIGGGFYAAYVSYIDPESVMSFRFSLLFALPAVLGGIGTLWGALVGAAILIPLTEISRSYLGGTGSGIDLMLYGVLVMAIALARPEGILSLFRRTRSARNQEATP